MRSLAAVVVAGAVLLAGASTAGAVQWAVQPAIVPPGPPDGQLRGVSCLRHGFCFAVGSNTDLTGAAVPQVQYFNGRWWRRLSVPDGAGTLNAIACTSGSSCFAVGSLIERWNGRRWTISRTRVRGELNGVACAGPRICMAVGDANGRPLAFRWDGRRWTRSAVPVGGLLSVSCSSAVACTAVGARGGRTLAVRWNGRRWRVQATPTPELFGGLNAVSCSAARACTAVGTSSSGGSTHSLAEHWNGSRWSAQPTVRHASDVTVLTGVACRSPRDCTAVGWFGSDTADQGIGPGSTLSERWNGRSWSAQRAPNATGANVSRLSGISCAAGHCVTVGDASTGDGPYLQRRDLALHYSGKWLIHGVPTPPGHSNSSLSAVSCVTTNSCVAVGSQSKPGCCQVLLFDERWDGHTWRLDPIPQPPGALDGELSAIFCVSSTRCFGVGSAQGADHHNRPLTEIWDGTRWTIESSPDGASGAENYLNAIACRSATDCTAVGDYYNDQTSTGGTLIEHWNGADWSVQSSATSSTFGASLDGVSCTATDACIAVGQDGNGKGIAARWDGAAWASVPGPPTSPDSVSCASPTSCQAVGFKEIASWDGSSWTRQSAPALSDWRLMGVTCRADNDCTAVGATKIGSGSPTALAESWNGQRWSVQSSPALTKSTFSGVSCPAAGACVAVGSENQTPLIEATGQR